MDLVAALPERWRALALAVLSTLVAAQMASSALVAVAPPAALSHPLLGPVLRALHRFGHMRFQSEPGTLKLPFAPLATPALDETSARRAFEAYALGVGGRSVRGEPLPAWPDLPARIRDAWMAADLASRATTAASASLTAPPPTPPTDPPAGDSDRPTLVPGGDPPTRTPTLRMAPGQSGRAGLGALVMAAALSALCLVACPKPTPGPVVTPSGIVATLDSIAAVLDVLVDALRPLVLRALPDAAQRPVAISLTGFETAARAWLAGRETWTARGADRCEAYALSGALTDATRQLVVDLGRAGVGWGPDLAALLTSLGRLTDRLIGPCAASTDGGALASSGRTGDAVRALLDDVDRAARLRGAPLVHLPAVRR